MIHFEQAVSGFSSKQEGEWQIATPEAQLFIFSEGSGKKKETRLAMDRLQEVISHHFLAEPHPVLRVRQFFLQVINTAHFELIELATQEAVTGVTLIMVIIQQGQIHWAKVGNGALYLVSGRNSEEYISADNYPRKGTAEEGESQIGDAKRMPTIEFGGPFTLNRSDLLLLCSQTYRTTLGDKALLAGSDTTDSLTAWLKDLTAVVKGRIKPGDSDLKAIALKVSEIEAVTPPPVAIPLDRVGASRTFSSAITLQTRWLR
ncbi:MAG: hypothetical protein HQL49_13125 [Gammaproteobacteria bacterium]|nr:hypothetical protein [Gammaproteobacteria bacterium]